MASAAARSIEAPRLDAEVPLVIGLVNNMPDAALRATERQFRDLLVAAAVPSAVRLKFFYLPAIPRGAEARAYIAQNYEEVDRLWTGGLDALIVTGNEPKAPRLHDEPYWPEIARLIDWAEENTISTIWSCLAAHAAAFHLDKIDRRALDGKLFGLFDCDRAADDPLMAHAPPRWRVPHSRWNEVPEAALVAGGYRILSRSAAAGADFFVRERKSLFLFFQGHPEYDPGALGREYRRDVGRFLAGTMDRYPALPVGYFDPETAAMLEGFRSRALQDRDPGLLTEFPPQLQTTMTAEVGPQRPGVWLYRNWLRLLAERKECRGNREESALAEPEPAIS